MKTAVIDLFRSILVMDALAWAATRAAEPPGEPFADLECLLSKTYSELMLQLLSTMPSEFSCLASHSFRSDGKFRAFGVHRQ